MKRLLILLTLLMFTLPNCTNTSEDSENIFNNNENNTQDKTEEEEEIQKEITLTSSKLTNITIKTPPVKTEYTAGETFDPAGLYLQATYTDTYSDGTQKENIEFIDCETEAVTFTGTDFAEAGTATVTVTYKGKNATFSVKVTEKPTDDVITDVTADYSPELKLNDPKYEGKNVTVIINEKEYSIVNLKDLSDKKQESKADTTSFVIPKDAKVQLDASYINGTNNNIIDGNYGNIVVVNTKGKDAGDGFQYTSTEISISNETELVLTGNFSIPALSIENKNVSRAINMQDVTIVDTILANGADVPFPMPVTTSDLIDTFNNLLPSGQTMSPVLESHPTTLSTAFSSLPQLALTLDVTNATDSKLKNQYINILKEYYDNDKAKLNDLYCMGAIYLYADGREEKAVDDIVGLYDENNKFNDPDDPKCTTPTTLPVYDVGFLKFANIQGVDGFKNIVVTGDVTSDTTTDLDFTNVVFTGDVSGIDNTGTYRGVIHFKDEPMKDIYSEYALIKIDTPPTGEMARITGGIMDFRDMSDNLTSDPNYDIYDHLTLQGHNKIARGYFKDETQKKYIAPKVEGTGIFADTYFEPVDTELMKTLQTVEKAANEDKLRDLFDNHPKSTEAQSTEPITE